MALFTLSPAPTNVLSIAWYLRGSCSGASWEWTKGSMVFIDQLWALLLGTGCKGHWLQEPLEFTYEWLLLV